MMLKDAANEVVDGLRRLALGDGAAASDGALLDAYAAQRDEAALTALVQRHGGMVWGVCRRILGGGHDAEDAFQATFLVLLSKATGLRDRNKVANWLYGVAQQTAVRARCLRAQQAGREKQVSTMPDRAQPEQAPWTDVAAILDEELGRLPEKYRAVIVLCDLEEKSRSEAARLLGCPEGTVAGRLARARALLARRLNRRGVSASAGALASTFAALAAPAPAGAVAATVQSALAGTASATVAALVQGVLQALFMRKLKIGALLLVAVLTCAAGSVAVYSFMTRGPDPADARSDPGAGKSGPAMPLDRAAVQGRLLPVKRLWVFAPMAGRVAGVKKSAEPGSKVAKGEELIRMFSRELKEKLDQIDAEIGAAKKQFDLHRDDKEQIIERMDAQRMLDARSKEREVLIRRTDAIASKPGDFLVKAPMDGTVLSAGPRGKLLDIDVEPGEPLLCIGATDGDWELEVVIPEAHVGAILDALEKRADRPLDVELRPSSDPARKYAGKLDRGRIAASAVAGGFRAWVRLDGKDIGAPLPRGLLRLGDDVHAVIMHGGVIAPNRPLTPKGQVKAQHPPLPAASVLVEIDGVLEKIHVREGQMVKKGQVLAEFSNLELDRKRASASSNIALHAGLAKAYAAMAAADAKESERYRKLEMAARSDLRAAERELDLLHGELDRLALRAPRTGIVRGLPPPSDLGRHWSQAALTPFCRIGEPSEPRED